jgi:hypothetical protein
MKTLYGIVLLLIVVLALSSRAEDDEASSSVGPDKGILEASAEEGITLSPEAYRNFEIRTLKLAGSGPWDIPASARLLSGEEVNLYRWRDGHFKRVDFTLVKRLGDRLTITSHDLTARDEIAVQGVGFLRMAELIALGGAPEGHSH